MKNVVYRMSLDIHKYGAQAVLNVKKADTGRVLRVSLRAGSEPYSIEADCYAVFKATKPDGTVLYNSCTIEGNEIVYEFTEQTCTAVGKCRCEIALYDLGDKLITSPSFTLLVNGAIYPDGRVESADEFSALTELLVESREAINDAAEASLKAETSSGNADVSAGNADRAAQGAMDAAGKADTATQEAKAATSNANAATQTALQSAGAATEAAQKASKAASDAESAANRANTAAETAFLNGDSSITLGEVTAEYTGVTLTGEYDEFAVADVVLSHPDGYPVQIRGVAESTDPSSAVNKRQLDESESRANKADENIIDRLCPAFEKTGAIVTCEPVENHPLRMVSYIDETRIAKRSAVNLTRRNGKNLFGGDALADKIAGRGGTKDSENGTITFNPGIVGSFALFSAFKENTQYTFILKGSSTGFTAANLHISYTDSGVLPEVIQFSAAGEDETVVVTTKPGKTVSAFSVYHYYTNENRLYYDQCGVFEGVVSQEDFVPYNGDTFTMELGRDVYGGTLDWTTGVLTVNYSGVIFDGTTSGKKLENTDDKKIGYAYINMTEHPNGVPKKAGKVYFNKATGNINPDYHSMVVFLPTTVTGAASGDSVDTVVSKFNAVLANWYGAGVPLIAAYELNKPITVKLTPQEIRALSGVNTIFSNTGDTTVGGRADPVAIIDKMQTRLAALEAVIASNT